MLSQGSWSPSQLRTLAGVGIQAVALALIGAAFFVRIPHVAGLSMAPHIDSGEVVLVDTVVYRWRRLHREDIIAFKHDQAASDVYLKRVVGIPGDRIEIRRGQLIRNGTPVEEPYVRFRDDGNSPPCAVPADSYYVLGDNRANSDDSRRWGFVRADQIVGHAVMGLWPLARFGAL